MYRNGAIVIFGSFASAEEGYFWASVDPVKKTGRPSGGQVGRERESRSLPPDGP